LNLISEFDNYAETFYGVAETKGILWD